MLIMHSAVIIELFDAGLFGNGRLKNYIFNLWMPWGYRDIRNKLPAGLTMKVVLRSAYSQI